MEIDDAWDDEEDLAQFCVAQNTESERQEGLPLTDATRQEAQEPVGCLHRDYTGAYYVEPTRPDIARHLGKELYAAPQPPAPCPKCDELEPVAIRTFDGEGGYDYLNVEDNENYVADWNRRNPNYAGWVEYLVLKSDAAATIGVITQERDALQAKVAELEAEAAENCRIIGMSSEREARHLAAISELERECNGLAARIGKELNVENEALKVSVSEQAALIEKCRGALDYTACGFTSVKAKNTSVSMAQEALAAIAAQKGGAA